MKATLLILIALLSTNWTKATDSNAAPLAEAEISGTLMDETSQKPVEYASIILFNMTDSSLAGGCISDSLGKFRIKELKKGNYKVVISYVGYGKTEIKDIVISSARQHIDLGIIKISPNSLMLAKANVVAERNVMEFHADKQVINSSAVQSAANGTVLDLLKNSPAISVDNDDNVTLRGSNSFTLLVDGKPLAINAKDALRQIPSSTVDRIEIITNPSSKYDAEGSGGIINIILKKIKKDGFSALINAKTGTFGNYSGDVSVNWNKGKWGINGMMGYSRDQRKSWSRNEQETLMNDSTYYLNWESQRRNINTNAFALINATYMADKHNTFGINTNFSKMSWGMDLLSEYESYINPSDQSNYISDYYFRIPGNSVGFDLNYSHTFDTTARHLDISFSNTTWIGTVKHHSERYDASENFDKIFLSQGNEFFEDSKQLDQRAKIDYNGLMLKKITFETGYQYTSRPYNADFIASRYNNLNSTWYIDNQLSSTEDFDMINHAAYILASMPIKKLEISAGLRGEHLTNTFRLDSPNYNDIKLKYLNWFPSFSVSKTFTNQNQLQGSYSRRVNYPQDWMIGPTPMYSDGFVYQAGNPYLRPELTDSYELNQVRYIKKRHLLSTTAYYRHTKDAMSRVMSVNAQGVMIVGWENFATNDFLGIEIGSNLNLGKKLNINFSGNVYYVHNKGKLADMGLDYSDFSWNSHAMVNYKVCTNTRIQLSGFVNGAGREMQGSRNTQGMISFSFRQDFLNQKLSATLNFQDIFNMFRWKYDIKSDNYIMRVDFKPEYPAISLGLSYKINNFRQTIRNESGGGPGVGI